MGAEGVRALAAELDLLVEVERDRVRNRQHPLAAWQLDPVVAALGQAHDPVATEALARAARALVVADAPLTAAVLEALAQDGSQAALDGLVDVALERSGEVAAQATGALAAQAPAEALPVVEARLRGPDPAVRSRGVALVVRLAGAGAVPALLPLLADENLSVRDAVTTALGEVGDERAVLPLLVAEETDRRTRRHGLSAVTFSGRVSPHLRAAAQVVTGDRTLGWDLSRRRPYDAEAELDRVLAPAVARQGEALQAATADLPSPRLPSWTVSTLEDLLTRDGVSRHDLAGAELVYLDGTAYVTDRERCRRLGLALTEARGDTHDTVYGERVDQVASVTGVDGVLVLVADGADVRRAEDG
jgi:HEAT repeat protein